MTHEIVSVLCGGRTLMLAAPDSYLEQREINLRSGETIRPSGYGVRFRDNMDNAVSPCEAYQELLESCKTDVIIYVHDDVTIHDADWLERVMALFENPQCVAVGLGGATGLGNRDLYRKPYSIWNLARTGYASNQDDAETHGARFTGVRRCATIEQFFMAIRTEWLRSRRTLGRQWTNTGRYICHDIQSGWPTQHLTHHLLDGWLACEAARDGKEIWQVGISCAHHGGGSSTSDSYAKANWLQGGSMERDHILPHKWLASEYVDVLPLEVTP